MCSCTKRRFGCSLGHCSSLSKGIAFHNRSHTSYEPPTNSDFHTNPSHNPSIGSRITLAYYAQWIVQDAPAVRVQNDNLAMVTLADVVQGSPLVLVGSALFGLSISKSKWSSNHLVYHIHQMVDYQIVHTIHPDHRLPEVSRNWHRPPASSSENPSV